MKIGTTHSRSTNAIDFVQKYVQTQVLCLILYEYDESKIKIRLGRSISSQFYLDFLLLLLLAHQIRLVCDMYVI